MRFSVVNLGCKVNRAESDAIAAALLSRGCERAELPDADLVVVNTCTVTGEAEKKTRKALRQALRRSPHAQVVATGCAVALDPAAYESIDARIRAVPKAQLLEAVQKGLTCEEAAVLRAGESFNARVDVKVQDGCDNACTYCIVHTARGRSWSRPAKEIVGESVALMRAGVGEIVLSGINLGSYGGHAPGAPDEGLRLAGLLKLLIDAADRTVLPGREPARFRISSIEPRDLDDDLIDLLECADGRVCRHLHLPLQSGSSKVLREMARPYSAQDYLDLVERLRGRIPRLSLSTDVIAGFPGETEQEFQETMALCEACGFSKMHVFPYSQRAGTPAAAREDQVEAQVRADRAARLRALGERLRADDYARRVGSREAVAVERAGIGTTESYYEVAVPCDLPKGSLVFLDLPEHYENAE